MRFRVLATDYDGTLATNGVVSRSTYEALRRLKKSGRSVVLVTGRELEDLFRVFPGYEICDRIVAENGAIVYDPSNKKLNVIAEKPPDAFISALKARGIQPLSVGHVIVATWHPNEVTVMEVIRQLGLELQIVFNKGAVMVLPTGTNKAAGMAAALRELKISAHNVVAVGDAENDHAFLKNAELSVAVSNALPMVKETADVVTKGDHGAGVEELIRELLESDLSGWSPSVKRLQICIGQTSGEEGIYVPSFSTNILVAGVSGGGKTTLATFFLERLSERQYQFCIVDPEGDYSELSGSVVYGDAEHPPNPEEISSTLEDPAQNVVANLLAIPLEDRPPFLGELFAGFQQLRSRYGRPHWIILDEAHHLLPKERNAADFDALPELQNIFMITVEPESLSKTALSLIDRLIIIGKSVDRTLHSFTSRTKFALTLPADFKKDLDAGEALLWNVKSGGNPMLFQSLLPEAKQKRHTRKYSEGELPPDRSFYFRGPKGKLNLRAQNLMIFLQIAEGVDDETWLYHLRNQDYSRWFREKIKDENLAVDARSIEQDQHLDADESRKKIRVAIEKRYTASA